MKHQSGAHQVPDLLSPISMIEDLSRNGPVLGPQIAHHKGYSSALHIAFGLLGIGWLIFNSPASVLIDLIHRPLHQKLPFTTLHKISGSGHVLLQGKVGAVTHNSTDKTPPPLQNLSIFIRMSMIQMNHELDLAKGAILPAQAQNVIFKGQKTLIHIRH